MVAPVPFSIHQLDRLIQKKQMATAKKVARKPNPRDEEKYNEKNRQAQSFQEILLSQALRMAKMAKR